MNFSHFVAMLAVLLAACLWAAYEVSQVDQGLGIHGFL